MIPGNTTASSNCALVEYVSADNEGVGDIMSNKTMLIKCEYI